MRARLSLILVGLIVNGGFFLGLAFTPVQGAPADCAATYTVQAGDHLYAIARALNISAVDLIRLNRERLPNPNLIHRGQVLCLPVRPNNSRVAIEALYSLASNANNTQAQTLHLTAPGNRLAKRVVYPLQPIEPIDSVATTTEVYQSLTTNPPPAFFGVRNGENAITYTLVAVGKMDVVQSLRVEGKDPVAIDPGCTGKAVKDTLQEPAAQSASVTLSLEGEDGVRYPFSISHFAFAKDANSAAACFADKLVAFAVFPSTSSPDKYRILIRLTEEGFGPPGRRWRLRCSDWSGYFGWAYRWLMDWYGC